jgi:hypothetical protein
VQLVSHFSGASQHCGILSTLESQISRQGTHCYCVNFESWVADHDCLTVSFRYTFGGRAKHALILDSFDKHFGRVCARGELFLILRRPIINLSSTSSAEPKSSTPSSHPPPEERTMSVFTKMNTPARNRQQVRTLVDMTQIRQWHMYDPEVSRVLTQFKLELTMYRNLQKDGSLMLHSVTSSL